MHWSKILNDIYLHVRHCRHRTDISGTAWGPRTIPDYELVLVAKGRYQYVDANGFFDVNPGELLLIEPQVRHSFCKIPEDDPGVHLCAHFDLVDLHGNIFMVHQFDCKMQRVTKVDNFDYIYTLFAQAASDFVSYSPFHTELVNTAIRQIWLRTADKWYKTDVNPLSGTITNMMSYLRENLTRPVTRNDLATHFHYSPEHVNYLFKRAIGISPSRFLNRERVIRAFRYLCEDGLSVQEAALKTGFSSQYYFSRVFKEIFGYPPAKLRKYIDLDLQTANVLSSTAFETVGKQATQY
jgi:AraC-like DNA-binding protein